MVDSLHCGKAIEMHTHVISLDPTFDCYLSLTVQRCPHTDEVHHNKLIHGSDFPVPINAWGFVGELSVAEILKINKIKSPIPRDYVIKKELGFPKEVFTRGGKLITERKHGWT